MPLPALPRPADSSIIGGEAAIPLTLRRILIKRPFVHLSMM